MTTTRRRRPTARQTRALARLTNQPEPRTTRAESVPAKKPTGKRPDEVIAERNAEIADLRRQLEALDGAAPIRPRGGEVNAKARGYARKIAWEITHLLNEAPAETLGMELTDMMAIVRDECRDFGQADDR